MPETNFFSIAYEPEIESLSADRPESLHRRRYFEPRAAARQQKLLALTQAAWSGTTLLTLSIEMIYMAHLGLDVDASGSPQSRGQSNNRAAESTPTISNAGARASGPGGFGPDPKDWLRALESRPGVAATLEVEQSELV